MSTFCHGVASAQAIDKSGEIVEIKGLDITSLPRTGILNYEHKSEIPGQICGKIITAKKIFSENDCENEHEIYFWNKCKVPFVYITAELLDDYCQSGKDVAGILQYDYDRKGQNKYAILGFSVEGSELPGTRQQKILITKSIARKVTITSAPCNSLCIAELLEENKPSQVKDDFDELFKSKEEACNLFKSGEGEKLYENYLAKKEAEGPSMGGRPPKSPSAEYQGQGIQSGKTKGGESAFSHGHIAPYKFNPAEHQEGGEFHEHAAVKAKNPKLQENKAGRMKINANATQAGGRRENRAALSLTDKDKIAQQQGKQQLTKAEHKGVPHGWTPSVSNHKKVGAITSLTHPEHGMVSVHKNPKTSKYEVNHAGRTAGIKGKKGIFDNHKEAIGHMQKYVHALHNGSVLGRTMHAPDTTDIKKAITAGSYNAAPSTLVNGSAYQTENLSSGAAKTGAEGNNFQGTKKDWNKQAKEDYDHWPYKDKFEKFMKARMPHLADGEIKAIGRVLSLKKTIELEKSLENLIKSEEPKLGNHFLMSAENPMHPHKNELKMDHKQTLAHLKSKGYNANEVKGHYGSPETSIMVHGVNPKQAEELHGVASKLGQDSSIYSNGGKHEMRFHHGEQAGKKVHGEGTVFHKDKPKDFYTTLPNGKHFTHNFNF